MAPLQWQRAKRLLKSPSFWLREGIEPGAFIWMFLVIWQVDTAIKSNPDTMFRWRTFGEDPWRVAPWAPPVLAVLLSLKLLLTIGPRLQSWVGSARTTKGRTQKPN